MLTIVALDKNPKLKKHKTRKIRKRIIKRTKNCTVVRIKKNPAARKKHLTVIVGYGRTKGKRTYFTGTGFSKLRAEAKKFSGDAARHEARRILPMLPNAIYGIKVENA